MLKITPALHKKIPRGQTLLEAIIAIGVIMVGVVGALVLINTTINLGRQNQDRIVAQNLAREGLELAYSLRSSASLYHSQDAATTWDKYLFAQTRINLTEYNNTYNIGVWSDPSLGGDGQCYQRCSTSDPSIKGCLSPGGGFDSNGNPIAGTNGGFNNTAGIVKGDTGNDEMDMACDSQALIGYLYRDFPQLPPYCDSSSSQFSGDRPYWNGSVDAQSVCNYDGDNKQQVDISDLSNFIDNVYLKSKHYVEAYPTILTQVNATNFPNETLNFYIEPANGTVNLTSLWNDARARVYEYNGTYIQNPPASFSGTTTPTKYYRVVTLQEVCRANDNTETIVDQTSAGNCENLAMGQKVGVLVTSEVKWPKSTSATSVKYQEYLYNWITP